MTETPEHATDNENAAKRRWGRVLTVLGAVLILAGIGTALWRFWPELRYSTGLIDDRYPYPSRLLRGGEASSNDEIPMGQRVVIPVIGADVVVSDDDQTQALRDGAYRHVETELPGEGGTTTLAGHRAAGKFALLSKLRPGDYVILYWDGVEYDYEVSQVWTTTPDDAEPLDDVGYERLVLYTCVPRYLGNERTVVEARPVP